MNPAPNLALVGPMGSGKSSIGRRLAERAGLVFVDADRRIEQQAGADVPTIFDCEGESGFRNRERLLLADLLQREGQLVATGGGAVLDARTRELLRRRSFVVHLHADVDTQLQRLARDRQRPLLQRADRADALRELARIRGPLYDAVADLRFDTATLSPADAAVALARLLRERWECNAAGAAA